AVGQARRPLIELAVRQASLAAHDRFAIGDGVRHALEQVGEVEASYRRTMGDVRADLLVGADGLVPKDRYISREFLDLEMERLWTRVWQVACREEEIAEPGAYVEYTIGDQSILVVRSAPDEISAYTNSCLHRGTRLAEGTGSFARGRIQCRYHGWCDALDG